MLKLRLGVLTLVAALGLVGLPATAENEVLFETDHLHWLIGSNGQNQAFTERGHPKELAEGRGIHPLCRSALAKDQVFPVSALTREGNTLKLQFDGIDAEAVLQVAASTRSILPSSSSRAVSEVIETLRFAQAPLALEGLPEEAFAACLLALNLETNVQEIQGCQVNPGPVARWPMPDALGWRAREVALVATPQARLREVMKEVVRQAEALPKAKNGEYIGGPWALDAPINRGSYLFDFGKLTEETVDDWIACAQRSARPQPD